MIWNIFKYVFHTIHIYVYSIYIYYIYHILVKIVFRVFGIVENASSFLTKKYFYVYFKNHFSRCTLNFYSFLNSLDICLYFRSLLLQSVFVGRLA